MGYGSTAENVLLILEALEEALDRQGYKATGNSDRRPRRRWAPRSERRRGSSRGQHQAGPGRPHSHGADSSSRRSMELEARRAAPIGLALIRQEAPVTVQQHGTYWHLKHLP